MINIIYLINGITYIKRFHSTNEIELHMKEVLNDSFVESVKLYCTDGNINNGLIIAKHYSYSSRGRFPHVVGEYSVSTKKYTLQYAGKIVHTDTIEESYKILKEHYINSDNLPNRFFHDINISKGATNTVGIIYGYMNTEEKEKIPEVLGYYYEN